MKVNFWIAIATFFSNFAECVAGNDAEVDNYSIHESLNSGGGLYLISVTSVEGDEPRRGARTLEAHAKVVVMETIAGKRRHSFSIPYKYLIIGTRDGGPAMIGNPTGYDDADLEIPNAKFVILATPGVNRNGVYPPNVEKFGFSMLAPAEKVIEKSRIVAELWSNPLSLERRVELLDLLVEPTHDRRFFRRQEAGLFCRFALSEATQTVLPLDPKVYKRFLDHIGPRISKNYLASYKWGLDEALKWTGENGMIPGIPSDLSKWYLAEDMSGINKLVDWLCANTTSPQNDIFQMRKGTNLSGPGTGRNTGRSDSGGLLEPSKKRFPNALSEDRFAKPQIERGGISAGMLVVWLAVSGIVCGGALWIGFKRWREV